MYCMYSAVDLQVSEWEYTFIQDIGSFYTHP